LQLFDDGVEQLPPLHVDGGISVSLVLHDDALHCMPALTSEQVTCVPSHACWHPLLPVHCARGVPKPVIGCEPELVAWHEPGTVWQSSHGPELHGLLQQTPSTQLPLLHSVARVQVALLLSVLTHAPALQYFVLLVLQSLSTVHEPQLVLFAHVPEHACVGGTGATHTPLRQPVANVTMPPEQLCGTHCAVE
jgi:hypothetical protein